MLETVRKAQEGDAKALEAVARSIQDQVHRLARRQADGRWKMVIDNPHGARLLNQ